MQCCVHKNALNSRLVGRVMLRDTPTVPGLPPVLSISRCQKQKSLGTGQEQGGLFLLCPFSLYWCKACVNIINAAAVTVTITWMPTEYCTFFFFETIRWKWQFHPVISVANIVQTAGWLRIFKCSITMRLVMIYMETAFRKEMMEKK